MGDTGEQLNIPVLSNAETFQCLELRVYFPPFCDNLFKI